MNQESKLSDEQIAHDVALSYVQYVNLRREEDISIESFYQEYLNAYDQALKNVKHYK